MVLNGFMPFKGVEGEELEEIKGTFIRENYLWLVNGLKPDTVAIDICAYIGDVSVYLAMQPNIKQVLAYEAYPEIFEKLENNVRLSPRSEKIKALNQGIGRPGSDYTVMLSAKKKKDFELLEASKKGKPVKITDLNAAIKEANSDKIIVKMNCGGGEFFILDSGLDLSSVYKMQVLVYLKIGNINTLQSLLTDVYGFKTDIKPEMLPETEWLYAWRE